MQFRAAIWLAAASCTSSPEGASLPPNGTFGAPGAAGMPRATRANEGPAVELPLPPEGAAEGADGAGVLLPGDAAAAPEPLRGVCWNPVGVGATHRNPRPAYDRLRTVFTEFRP